MLIFQIIMLMVLSITHSFGSGQIVSPKGFKVHEKLNKVYPVVLYLLSGFELNQ